MDALQQTQRAAALGHFHVCFDHNSSCHSHKASTVFSSLNHQRLRCRALFHRSGPSRAEITAERRRHCLQLPRSPDELVITSVTEIGRAVPGGIDKSCRGSERMFRFMFQNSFIPRFKMRVPGERCGALLWMYLYTPLKHIHSWV